MTSPIKFSKNSDINHSIFTASGYLFPVIVLPYYSMKNRNFCSFFFACCLLPVTLFSCKAGKIKQPAYEFTNVRRGTIERTVSSSGTINPVSTVKVLPQMSGKVERIYVDYNDPVRKGDILAELNTDMLRLKREQQYAAVTKARANYELQMINYQNQLALARKNLISEYELKTISSIFSALRPVGW